MSSTIPSSHGDPLDFKFKPRHVLGDPDYPWEVAERLGVPVSEKALLMGRQERRPFQQSALLAAKIVPTGLYTVRSQNIPLSNEYERQAYTSLPQTSRVVGELSKPSPILMTPKGADDSIFKKPYMSSEQVKKERRASSVYGTVRSQTMDVRQGLADMSARYKTNMVPPQAIYGRTPVTPAQAAAGKGIMISPTQQVGVAQPTMDSMMTSAMRASQGVVQGCDVSYDNNCGPVGMPNATYYGGYTSTYPHYQPRMAQEPPITYTTGALNSAAYEASLKKKYPRES